MISEATPEQDKLVADARALLKPTPVEPGIPNWFRLAALRAFGNAGWRSTAGWAVMMVLQDKFPRGPLFDHWGKCKWGHKLAFVTEPYNLTPAVLQEADELAQAIGCSWQASPNSWHFPGHTFRIVFYQKDERNGAK